MNDNNLTNQELIQELQKRIKEGNIVAESVVDEVQENSTSLLSLLGGKELLLLVGLTTAAVIIFCQAVKVTSKQVSRVKTEFDCNPPVSL